MYYIYILCDPQNENIRYVGLTNNPKERCKAHITDARNVKSPGYHLYKNRWIRKILSKGLKPELVVVESTDCIIEANFLEKFYITYLSYLGFKLTNSHGSDVTIVAKETREKMSKARKNKTWEELYGVEKAKEMRITTSERNRTNNPNKSNNTNVKIKISNTLKTFFENKENHWAYSQKFSEDLKEKFRQSHLNNERNVGNRKPRTEEQKERIRKSLLGRKVIKYKILQYDLDMNFIKEWPSLNEIIRNTTFSKKALSDCCKGLRKSYGNFIWKYKT